MSLHVKIYELFLCDKKVLGLRNRLDNAKRLLRIKNNKLIQLQTQHQELSSQLKATQTKASTFEHQAQDIEKRINHLREQMNNVTNNKEYSALLVEANTLKLDKEKIEEEALAYLTRAEELQAEYDALSLQVKTQSKLVSASAKEVQERQTEVAGELAEAEEKREKAVADLDPDIVKKFNRLSDQYDGEAMGPVIEENPKNLEYHCGGCYISLPIESVNALIMKQEQLTNCTSCGRILYMPEQLKSAMSERAQSKKS